MREGTSIRPRTREQFERALVDLVSHGLTARRQRLVQSPIDAHTPLFESGLVDSLAILELIAFVERATGRRIPPRQVHMKHFGTIDRICSTFWSEQREVGDDKPQVMVS